MEDKEHQVQLLNREYKRIIELYQLAYTHAIDAQTGFKEADPNNSDLQHSSFLFDRISDYYTTCARLGSSEDCFARLTSYMNHVQRFLLSFAKSVRN